MFDLPSTRFQHLESEYYNLNQNDVILSGNRPISSVTTRFSSLYVRFAFKRRVRHGLAHVSPGEGHCSGSRAANELGFDREVAYRTGTARNRREIPAPGPARGPLQAVSAGFREFGRVAVWPTCRT